MGLWLGLGIQLCGSADWMIRGVEADSEAYCRNLDGCASQRPSHTAPLCQAILYRRPEQTNLRRRPLSAGYFAMEYTEITDVIPLQNYQHMVHVQIRDHLKVAVERDDLMLRMFLQYPAHIAYDSQAHISIYAWAFHSFTQTRMPTTVTRFPDKTPSAPLCSYFP